MDHQGDQREPHDSKRCVEISYLERLGVHYYHCPAPEDVDRIAEERKYISRDEIFVTPEKMGDAYEEKLKMFFTEHLHEDEEIRYIKGGAGYFDVRSEKEDWIRIRLEKDDMIILPAGIFHRFTTDSNNVSFISHSDPLGGEQLDSGVVLTMICTSISTQCVFSKPNQNGRR